MNEVTQILGQIEDGNCAAAEKLLPLVYEQLRQLAAIQLSNERAGISLQPTALVHEAYLRLVGIEAPTEWKHSGHFYAAAAESMRRILVENARRKQTRKRGGDRKRINLEMDTISEPQRSRDLISLDEALTKLEKHRPDIARLVALRYFGGLTMQQAASSLDVSLRTAERNWTYAKAWLLQEISADESGSLEA